MTWQDPRTPVSVTHIGKFTVTIFDQALYDASLQEYPDDNKRLHVPKANKVPPFAKQKPAARYNWTRKLDQPLNVTTSSAVALKSSATAVNEKVHNVNNVALKNDQDLVRNFVESREQEGHLFFWNDIAGFMHFPAMAILLSSSCIFSLPTRG
jgi:hypothetical protein